MSREQFSIAKIIKVFGFDITRQALVNAENKGLIPSAHRKGSQRVWDISDLPNIGERYGFMKKPESSKVVAIFTTKGGVLKSTIALNLARMAALHNISTCVIGLDMQCDITNALGYQVDLDNAGSLAEALEQLSQAYGLADLGHNGVDLDDLIQPTDIPTLSLIPETPDLVMLEREISKKNMREYWLQKHVIEPLKSSFELIILDCSPNWNLLISNALMSCDVLVSPLECKINNFNNLKTFRAYLDHFKQETNRNFEHIFIPTKYASTRKLSSEIRSWYLANVPGCIGSVIRESAPGEESVASQKSLPEYSPNSIVADEMRETIKEVWEKVLVSRSSVDLSKRKLPRRRSSKPSEAEVS